MGKFSEQAILIPISSLTRRSSTSLLSALPLSARERPIVGIEGTAEMIETI
jgi:hypothetical protein